MPTKTLARSGYVVVLAAAAALLSAVVAVSTVVSREQVWAPLGPYEDQAVVSRVPGVDGPAVMAGGVLVVEGVLCNNTDGPVEVLTTLSWQADSAGTFINVGIDVPQVREPGCSTFTVAGGNPFRNPMPPGVVTAARDLGPDVLWRVSGFEVAQRGTGTNIEYAPRAPFRTDEFAVVVEAPK